MAIPPPLPPATRPDYLAYTRKTRAFEPDAPELANKRIVRTRLTELERIPAEVRDIHRALLHLMPEQVFTPGFLKEVRRVIQQHTEMDVDLWLDAVRVLPRTQLRALIPGATFIGIIGLEPLLEKVLLEIDLQFVYAVVDKLLGGAGAAVDVHRPLTDIEQGVFSFLLLKVLALFQGEMTAADQVAVRLEDMRNDLRACADIVRREDHWLVVSWKMNVDLDVGFVRALLPVSLARRLGAARAPEDTPLVERYYARLRERLPRLAGLRFEGRVEAGHIEFTQEEIAALDPGDIVVLEETGLGLDEEGAPAGAAILRFGRGRRGAVHGVTGPVDDRRVFQVERFERFTIPATHDPRDPHGAEGALEEVMAEYEHHAEEADDGPVHPSEIEDEDWGLDSEDTGGDGYPGDADPYAPASDEEGYDEDGYEEEGYPDGQGYDPQAPVDEAGYVEADAYEEGAEADNLAEVEPLLGDMPVPVVVELGRVELTADEVLCLRPGQLLELGRSPMDPVDLVVNGRLLAKGELVEIEGQLGVRISSLAKGTGP